MATYQELFDYRSTVECQNLINRITVAVAIKAEAIAGGTPTAEQRQWAVEALSNPRSKADSIIGFVLAANAAATTTQITNATDAAIQSNVNDAVDTLFGV